MTPHLRKDGLLVRRGGLGAAVMLGLVLLSGCGQKSEAEVLAAARQQLAQRQATAAIVELKSLLQTSGSSAEARFLLGQALLDSGDPQAALVELRKASDLGHPEVQVAPVSATALIRFGLVDEVIKRYADTDLGTGEAMADLRTSLAMAYQAKGQKAQARAAIDSARKLVPDYAPAALFEARLLADERELARANALVDAVIGRNAKDADAWLLKGDLARIGAAAKTDQALDAYRQALAQRDDLVMA
jgi:cellulose synthase operon protein C